MNQPTAINLKKLQDQVQQGLLAEDSEPLSICPQVLEGLLRVCAAALAFRDGQSNFYALSLLPQGTFPQGTWGKAMASARALEQALFECLGLVVGEDQPDLSEMESAVRYARLLKEGVRGGLSPKRFLDAVGAVGLATFAPLCDREGRFWEYREGRFWPADNGAKSA